MSYEIELGEDVVEILGNIAKQVTTAEQYQDLTVEECLQVAITALVNSYDATSEDQADVPGEPIDAAALRKALDEKLNPDISTNFTQPEGDVKERQDTILTIEQLRQTKPNCVQFEILKQVDPVKDPQLYGIAETALRNVLSHVPVAEWDEELTAALIAKTIAKLLVGSNAAPAKTG